MNVAIRGDTKNENLEFIMQCCEKAANTFLDALPECTESMYYKAISVKQFEGEGAGAKWDILQDVITTSLGITMKKRFEEYQDFDIDVSTGVEEGYHVVMLHAKRKGAEEESTRS